MVKSPALRISIFLPLSSPLILIVVWMVELDHIIVFAQALGATQLMVQPIPLTGHPMWSG